MVFRNERTWQNAVDANKTEEFHQAYEAAVEQVKRDFGQKHPLVIDGKEIWTRETFVDTSPSNRKLVLGTFSKGGKQHAQQAIAAAKKAFPAWAATPWEERVRIFRRAADLVSAKKFYYAALMSFENVPRTSLRFAGDVSTKVSRVQTSLPSMNRGCFCPRSFLTCTTAASSTSAMAS